MAHDNKNSTRLIMLFSAAVILYAMSAGSVGAQDVLRVPEARFVPNSVIVRFKPQESPLSFQSQVERRQEQADSLLGKISLFQEDVALSLQGKSKPEEKLAEFNLLADTAGAVETAPINPDNPDLIIYTTDESKPVQTLVELFEQKEEVLYAEPNYLFSFFSTPNDSNFNEQWGMKKINAEAAWDISTGSKNILIADIDSGIDEAHPDLVANIVETKSFTPCAPGGDQLGHGTHTAGIIGAIGNNATGVAGLSWNAGLMILKVGCAPDDIMLSSIIAALDYAASKNAKVVNMSFGGPTCSQTLSDSIAHIVQQGAVVVAASGNSGQENTDSLCPASDPNVITVSAVGPSDELAYYSSWGSSVDVAAPGGNGEPIVGCNSSTCILSTVPPGRYTSIHGTSLAAPHVSGLVSLMLSAKPSLSPQEIKSILESTAVDLGDGGRDNKFGAGRINAAAALSAVMGNPAPTSPPPVQDPPTPPPSDPGNGNPPQTDTAPVPTDQPNSPDCYATDEGGDLDCDGAVTQGDLDHWKKIFQPGRGMLSLFNRWRLAFFSMATGQ